MTASVCSEAVGLSDSGSGSGGSVLAVHTGALGDIILFGHLLRRVRHQGDRITLIACGERGRLLSRMGVVDRTIDFDDLAMHEVFSDDALEACTLPGLIGRHDRLISCFAAGDMRAELRLAALCQAADAAFLPIRPAAEHRGHLLDLWLDMLGLDVSVGRRAGGIAAAWPLAACDKGCGTSVLREAGVDASEQYVVLHPGSGGREKCWSPESFRCLADSISNEGLTPVFVVGPVERDRWADERIGELAGSHAVVLCPSLIELTDILCGAAAYVGNDSGVSHLAGAVGVGSVVLFGASRSDHYAPVGQSVTVVGSAAMSRIGVGQVLAAVLESVE